MLAVSFQPSAVSKFLRFVTVRVLTESDIDLSTYTEPATPVPGLRIERQS